MFNWSPRKSGGENGIQSTYELEAENYSELKKKKKKINSPVKPNDA